MLLNRLFIAIMGISLGVYAQPLDQLEQTEHGLVKKACPCCRADGSLITRADADEYYDTGC